MRKPKKNPTNPASRGAEAIPAQRERRSRRAYHPRVVREDARRLPHAASGGQGIRHATATPAATRDKGEYGGRRGCRGACPSHPLPPAAQATTPRCRAEAASQRQEKSLVSVKTEKVTFYRSKGNLHAERDAPRRTTRKPKKISPTQRAGARRRSPRSGSAAAGAHITRA